MAEVLTQTKSQHLMNDTLSSNHSFSFEKRIVSKREGIVFLFLLHVDVFSLKKNADGETG